MQMIFKGLENLEVFAKRNGKTGDRVACLLVAVIAMTMLLGFIAVTKMSAEVVYKWIEQVFFGIY